MDLVVAVLLGFVQLVFAVLGGWLPTKKITVKQRRAIFVCLGLLGLGLTVWGAALAKQSGEESKRNQLGDAEHPPCVTEISLPSNTHLGVWNPSSFPAYGIHIRLYDDTVPNTAPVLVRDYSYAEIPGQAALFDDQPWTPPDDADRRHFFAQITSRTGVYQEELILQKAGNHQWERALRVSLGMKRLVQDIDSAWPREPNGDIRWGR